MSKFVPSPPQDPPQTLYHCILGTLDPDKKEIKPSLGYGTKITQKVRDDLGVSGTEKVPLVFASAYITKTLAFAFDYHKDEILMNSSIEGSDAEMAVVCNRDVTMSKPRPAKVFAFSSEGFVPAYGNSVRDRQYVSANPIPLGDPVVEIKTSEDLMRAGLQIFSFKEPLDQLYDPNAAPPYNNFINKTMHERNLSFDGLFSALIKEGTVVWENYARNINPDRVLAADLKIELPKAPGQKIPARAQKPLKL